MDQIDKGLRRTKCKCGNAVKQLPPPYLKLIEERDATKIYLVDGNHVRTFLDTDFAQGGHCFSFPKIIPKREIWIDQEAAPDEQQFIVDHYFIERALMYQGWSYVDALNMADRVQQKERHKKRLKKFLDTRPKHDKLPSGLYIKRLVEFEEQQSGLAIYLVNGKMIRDYLDIEFTEGGHDCVYSYIPEKEVWIDNDIVELERKFIVLHELVERRLMAEGMKYGRAHLLALKKEREARNAEIPIVSP